MFDPSFQIFMEFLNLQLRVNCPAINLFRQHSPSVGIFRNQGIGSVLWTSYLLMLGNAEVLRKDRILPFAFVSIDV